MKFSEELAEDSPFRARPFLDGKDAVTLATEILALDQEAFSASFRKSPMKRAKLRGLQRNASAVMRNAGSLAQPASVTATPAAPGSCSVENKTDLQ